MEELEIYDRFFMKTAKVISKIENGTNVANVAKLSEVTYAHANHIFKELVKNNLITIRKSGRDNIVTLTEKGARMQKCLREIDTIFKTQ